MEIDIFLYLLLLMMMMNSCFMSSNVVVMYAVCQNGVDQLEELSYNPVVLVVMPCYVRREG